MSIGDVIADLRRDTGFMANVTAWETLPARPGNLVEIPTGLHPALTGALHRRGFSGSTATKPKLLPMLWTAATRSRS